MFGASCFSSARRGRRQSPRRPGPWPARGAHAAARRTPAPAGPPTRPGARPARRAARGRRHGLPRRWRRHRPARQAWRWAR
ncbi:hypothetical protein EXJ73_11005 [Pelomonas aquatica]|uniref:Uncharacterized protein n=1 Tax=Pelomonas aquatica TaxID=431058 RepID=A0A9X4LHF9_9BURK|nr:hypothetical protein [Pelomonas aquatica]